MMCQCHVMCVAGNQQPHSSQSSAADMSTYHCTVEPRSEAECRRSAVGAWCWSTVCAQNRTRLPFLFNHRQFSYTSDCYWCICIRNNRYLDRSWVEHYQTLSLVKVMGVLVADATNFEGSKVPNFIEKPPIFVCFRTKSDVHPLRTKRLGEKPLHNYEIFGKTYLTLFAQ